jgi:hypothetical protein
MRTRQVVLGALVAGAVGVGAVLPALAQTEGDPAEGASEQTTDGTARGDRDHERWPEGPRDDRGRGHGEGRGMGPGEGAGLGGVHGDAFASALAAELGLPEDEVTAAIEAVTEQHRAQRRAERTEQLGAELDDAVEAGELTEEQADAIREAHEDGVLPFGRGEGRGGHAGPRGRAMLGG